MKTTNELYLENQMKHRTKKITEGKDARIQQLRAAIEKVRGSSVMFGEAKHWFFEIVYEAADVPEEIQKAQNIMEEQDKAQPIDNKEGLIQAMNEIAEEETEEKPKKKEPLTVDKAKLGVTLVLTHGDCTALGFDIKSVTTKDVAKEVRERLKLPEKPIRGA